MALSKDSTTIYIAAESNSNSTVSSWDINGTFHWGYVLTNNWIPDITLSPDETYLAFVDDTGNAYILNISTQALNSYLVGMAAAFRVSISPNSFLILVSGYDLTFGLFDSSMNVIQGVFNIGHMAIQSRFVNDS